MSTIPAKKQVLNLILRGFLYKKNYKPGSKRSQVYESYDIDFLEYCDLYTKLISQLEQRYKINLFFASYSSTPNSYIKKIKKIFNPKEMLLYKEKESSQFTTVCNALNEKHFMSDDSSLIFIIRSDLLITDLFISKLCEYNFEDKHRLYTISQDQNQNGNLSNHIDIFHAFYPEILYKFINWIQKGPADKKNRKDGWPRTAHYICEDFNCQTLFNIKEYDWLKGEGWYDYIDKGLIKDLYSTWSGVDNTWYKHETYKDFRLKSKN